MIQDLLTVVTATVGDSWEYLETQMRELRQFTGISFQQIVSDDGTLHDYAKRAQERTVKNFSRAGWTENPGPTFGIGRNLNHLLSLVKTPWAFVIEDAVRPGWSWLETAVEAVSKIGMRKWQGRRVGGIGLISSFDAWELEAAGLLDDHLGVNAYFGKASHETIKRFLSLWNDGLICWPRIIEAVRTACLKSEADSWPALIQETWRKPILEGNVSQGHLEAGLPRKFLDTEWPQVRRAWPAVSPGSWGLINVEAWRDVGGFCPDCSFYEAHLGIRMARKGYLSVNVDCPPWLHYPSLAFHAVAHEMGKTPRENRPDFGPNGTFARDFSCETDDQLQTFMRGLYPADEFEAIRQEMAEVEIYADPAWKEWM